MYKAKVYAILAILAGLLLGCGEAYAGEKGSLAGFWHSTPSISEGFKEAADVMTQGTRSELPAEGNLVSFKLAAGDPPSYNIYSFHIWKEDGDILFDASCSLNDGYTTRVVTLEEVSITAEDMEALQALCNEYKIAEDQREPVKTDWWSDNKASLEAEWENHAWIKTTTAYDVREALRNLYKPEIERALLTYFTELTARLKNAEPPKESPNGKVISFEMSEKDARGPFHIYRLREEGGQILLDANYGTPADMDNEVNLKNIVAAQEDMDALRALCNEYDFMPGKSGPGWKADGINYFDGSENASIVIWENGARRDYEKSFLGESAFKAFFNNLCSRLATPPAEGNVTSIYFSSSEGGFFNLREKDGKLLFDTVCDVYESGMKREIKLLRVAATKADMEALNAICNEYGFTELQQTYRPPFPSYRQKYHQEASYYLNVGWENGAAVHFDTHFGSEEALRAFFMELIARLERK